MPDAAMLGVCDAHAISIGWNMSCGEGGEESGA
jgi:hypothetical protein